MGNRTKYPKKIDNQILFDAYLSEFQTAKNVSNTIKSAPGGRGRENDEKKKPTKSLYRFIGAPNRKRSVAKVAEPMRVARLATRTLSQKSKQRYFAVTQMPDPCSPVEFGRVSAFLLQKLQSTRYAMATMIRRKISVKTKFCNRSSTADTSQSLLLSGST